MTAASSEAEQLGASRDAREAESLYVDPMGVGELPAGTLACSALRTVELAAENAVPSEAAEL